MEGEELIYWYQTTFQNTIEANLQLSKSSAPEDTPFVHKYQAIEHLKTLLEVKHPYNFITHCLLG